MKSPVSEEFRRRIISVWGEKGRAWLDQLPALVTACAKRWDLPIKSLIPDLSYNFVSVVVKGDGNDAILKLGFQAEEGRSNK
jgi:streptomycin 6-kinase